MSLGFPLPQIGMHRQSKGITNSLSSLENRIAKLIPLYKLSESDLDEPKIPHPDIFKTLSSKTLIEEDAFPTAAECAAHLVLLQCFNVLKAEVVRSTVLDKALDIKPEPKEVTVGRGRYETKVKKADDTFATRRKEKWPFFLNLAVIRFIIWLEAADEKLKKDSDEEIDDIIPPLDILMVWHSFLLNPGFFHRYCEDNEYKHVQKIAFPWKRISTAIDTRDFSFHRPARSTPFLQSLGFDSELLAYLTSDTIDPRFQKTIRSLHKCLRSQDVRVRQQIQRLSTEQGGFITLNPTRQILDVPVLNQDRVVKDLKAAVERQSTFVEKMARQLWIRSPVLEDTMRRAIGRYSKFLKLFKAYPGNMLVPTLDIDLVWHTHQLSSAAYRNDMLRLAGRFINHDDKIGKVTLKNGMENTARLFRIRFAREYDVCQCWDCEALLSAIENADKSIILQDERAAEKLTDEVAKKVMFYRAVESNRRKGEKLPSIENLN